MVRAELVSAYFFAIYVATVPYSNAAEAKMMLLYPTKRPRRQKWCYCTLQNRHQRQKGCYCTLQNGRGGQNGATVPYKTAAETKMMLLYPTVTPSAAKIALLSGSKRARRQKWRY